VASAAPQQPSSPSGPKRGSPAAVGPVRRRSRSPIILVPQQPKPQQQQQQPGPNTGTTTSSSAGAAASSAASGAAPAASASGFDALMGAAKQHGKPAKAGQAAALAPAEMAAVATR
jgi:hypothetical protein